MTRVDPGSTDPKLLERVRSLWDNPAWSEVFNLYAPFIRKCCSASGLDPASADELCQRIWVELVTRLPSYQYDPSGSFRGWLTRLCQRRIIDMYRERRDHCLALLGDDATFDTFLLTRSPFEIDPVDHVAPERLALLDEAMQIQDTVRRKVKPIRWEIFWRVMIQGESMPETAAAMGLKYATVYAAANHVARLLRAEGRRRVGSVVLGVPNKLENQDRRFDAQQRVQAQTSSSALALTHWTDRADRAWPSTSSFVPPARSSFAAASRAAWNR